MSVVTPYANQMGNYQGTGWGVLKPGTIVKQGGYTGPSSILGTSTGTGVYQDSGTPSYTPEATAPDPYAAQQAANAAYYDQQAALLNQQLGLLDTQRGVGQSNIDNSYNTSLNRLNEQKGIANRDYTTGIGDQEQGFTSARNTVATNVRSRVNALQRLLGIAGSGNSSATQDAVPLAAAREGSQQLDPVQTTYYQNRRNLDNGWNDTLMNYDNTLSDLANQKASQQNQLGATISQSHADILSKLAGLDAQRGVAPNQSYTDQIGSLLTSIAGLGGQYAGAVGLKNNLSFNSAPLSKYALGPQAAITQSPQATGVDPYLLPTLAKKDEQLANLG